MDPDLVEKIVHEVKSQGVFDEFRKDSIADVDTKPAYQNLRQRVDNAVNKFLSSTRWTPEMNKNQLREKLRRHIAESGFLDVGVERIVDQVVNPKIGTSFQPRIEEIAYTFLGLPLPGKNPEYTAQHTSLMPPLPPALPPLPSGALTIQTSNLMPTDLEQVSPDSDASNAKSDVLDDDEESPPFEPLIAHIVQEEILTEQNMDLSNTPSPPPPELEEQLLQLPPPLPHPINSREFQLISKNLPPPLPPLPPGVPGVDELPPPPPLPPMPQSPPQPPPSPSPETDATNRDEVSVTEITGISECTKLTCEKKTFDIMAAISCHDSQLSQVSSDSHLSTNDFTDIKTQHSPSEATTVNISEEAQMPKFNENSLETSNDVIVEQNPKEFHFDIKKDEIKFEGTERKTSFSCNENVELFNETEQLQPHQQEEPQKNEMQAEANSEKNDEDQPNVSVGSNTSSELSVELEKEQERESTPTHTTAESNFYSSLNDSSSVQLCIVDDNEGSVTNEDSATQSNSIVLLPQATSSPSPPLTHKSISTTKLTNLSPTTSATTTQKRKDTNDAITTDKMKKDKLLESKRHNKYSKDKSRHGGSSTNKINSSNHKRGHHKTDKERSSRKHDKKEENTKHHNRRHSSDKSNRSSRSSTHKSERSENLKKRHESPISKSNKKRNGDKNKRQEDDHFLSKERVIRQKSHDSNDDDDDNNNNGCGGGGTTNNTENSGQINLADGEKSKTTNDTKTCTTNNNIDDDKSNNATDDVQNYKENNKQNKVILLNDILQNPAIEFIEFDTRKNNIEPMQIVYQTVNPSTSPQHDINLTRNNESMMQDDEESCAELEYFKDNDIENLVERLKLLDNIIKLCQSTYLHYEVDELDDDDDDNDNEKNIVHIENSIAINNNNKEMPEIELKKNHSTTRKRHRNSHMINVPTSNKKDMKDDINCSINLTNGNSNIHNKKSCSDDNAYDNNNNCDEEDEKLSEEATNLHCFVKRKKIMEETIVFSTFSKFNLNAKENNLLVNLANPTASSYEQKTACRKITNRKSIEKQRYKSDDLYKPRSTIRSSRRRLSTVL